MIRFALYMWMRHVERNPITITENTEYQLLLAATQELRRLGNIEFWANELLHVPGSAARTQLLKLITLPKPERD